MRLDSVAYSAYVGDHRDCCVRALSVAANRPYDECYRLMARHGRKPNRGTYPNTSRAAYAEAGLQEVVMKLRINTRRNRYIFPTLTEFLQEHPSGRFVLHRRGHAFAVVDGVVHDWARGTGPRSRVRCAWVVKT